MKKALALVMAIAMIASMSAVSFALSTALTPNSNTTPAPAWALAKVCDTYYTYDAKTDALTSVGGAVKFGTTIYLSLLDSREIGLTEDKSVNNVKVDAKWDENGEYVSGVEIVKKKVAKIDGAPVTEGSFYFLAINTTGSKVDNVTVEGTVYFKGKSGSDKTADNYKIDHKYAVEFTLGYPVTDNALGANSIVVDEEKATIYDFTLVNGEYDIVMDDFTVTANLKGVKKVLLAVDNTVIDEVDEAYPEANIDYYALTGSFKKTATVVVELEDDEFLYEVVDGAVVAVDGEYDDWAEEFTFKTKNLGTYIISDVELELAEEVVVANPSTGAAA